MDQTTMKNNVNAGEQDGAKTFNMFVNMQRQLKHNN